MHGAISERTVGVVLENVNTMQADSKDVARMEKKLTCFESIEVSSKWPGAFELAEKRQMHKADAFI